MSINLMLNIELFFEQKMMTEMMEA
ncbi:hypothetical protein NPIL_603721, partial [Nephila pilipes]